MKLTSEYFESTGITVWQPARGHRYGEESIALAEFARVSSHDSVCELGSGVAVTALQIAAKHGPRSVVAVEIQKELHNIAVKNAVENNLDDVVTCVNDDFRRFTNGCEHAFDVVVANPPFFTAGEGRLSPCPQRATARHELSGTIEDFVKCAHRLLNDDGRFFVVFDKRRKEELADATRKVGFETAGNDEASGTSYLLAEFRKI